MAEGSTRTPVRAPCLARLLCLLLAVFLGSATLPLAAGELRDLRLVYQDSLRLHLDLDKGSVEPGVFVLDKPHRLVIDLPDTTVASTLVLPPDPLGYVRTLRQGQQSDGRLRLVLVLDRAVAPTYEFLDRSHDRRMLIDLKFPVPEPYAGLVLKPDDTGATAAADLAINETVASAGEEPAPAATAPIDDVALVADQRPAQPVVPSAGGRDVIIAIDPGHGGKDSGARGPRGSLEKEIVLDIAIRLYRALDAIDGVFPVMTRIDDIYLGLGKRPLLARQAGADVFLSIHADAVDRPGPSGSSVYVLSLDGASSTMAAWLARSEKENARMHGGDVELNELEPGLREAVLDLIQDHTLETSFGLGAMVLDELETVGPVHKRQVEQAGFAVLKSPDIPSILIETAFISNPEDEQKLRTQSYQQRLAEAIARGVVNWLSRHAPADTLLAQRRNTQ